MTTEAIERAAVERKEAMRAPGDRPRERRCAPAKSPLTLQRSVNKHEIRAKGDASTGYDFDGYASTVERGYEMYDFWGSYTEVVDATAFDASLARADLDVPLVLQHDPLRRIARTTNGSLHLSVDDVGLRTEAPGLDPADADVAYIAPKLKSGLIDEMSFRFDILSGQWSPDYDEFRITTADIHRGDVAIVGYGANPTTSANLRSLVDQLGVDSAAGLAELNDDELRVAEAALLAERTRRGAPSKMSLRDLLAIV